MGDPFANMKVISVDGQAPQPDAALAAPTPGMTKMPDGEKVPLIPAATAPTPAPEPPPAPVPPAPAPAIDGDVPAWAKELMEAPTAPAAEPDELTASEATLEKLRAIAPPEAMALLDQAKKEMRDAMSRSNQKKIEPLREKAAAVLV